jgi:hypothetical protein
MTNKEAYLTFTKNCPVSVYCQSWWMDAICGPENWDVWLYRKGEEILAAMPYYMERRGDYRYITKAPLTQSNGIVFRYDTNSKLQKRASFEEKVIDSAVAWLAEQKLDVTKCLMIGNDRQTDIAGAKAAGMDTLYMHTNLTPSEQAEADLARMPGNAADGHYEYEGYDWQQLAQLICEM